MNNHRAKPLPYQRKGVYKIERFRGRVLLADEMGLGKTLQALWALRRNREWLPALVVCPASLKHHWQHEAHRHVGLQSSICDGTRPPRVQASFTGTSPLTIINYDILRHWKSYLQKIKFRMIVFDECQYLINLRAKRTRAARALAAGIPKVMALSGTPLTNRPSELWPVLNILWPRKYESFLEYAQKYCDPRDTPWGVKYDGATNLDLLHKDLVKRGMIRRRKADVLKDLPDKVRRVIPCALSNPEEYRRASSDFIGWLKRVGPHKVRSASRAAALTRMGYLLRLCAKLKIRGVVDWANRFFEETDQKLVLYCVHTKAIEVLQRRIKCRSVTINGQVPSSKRQGIVDQFQNVPKVRAFFGNIGAAGTGINLTASSEVGFVEMHWRPGDHVQAEDRPHRIGQKSTVFVNYFVAEGTIEERLCQILQQKQEVLSSVLDGGSTPVDLNIYDELLKEMSGGGL